MRQRTRRMLSFQLFSLAKASLGSRSQMPVAATRRRTARRMDKNIQASKASHGIADNSVNILRPRHIPNDRDTLAASRLDCLSNRSHRSIVVSTINRNVATLTSQVDSNRSADSLAAARD